MQGGRAALLARQDDLASLKIHLGGARQNSFSYRSDGGVGSEPAVPRLWSGTDCGARDSSSSSCAGFTVDSPNVPPPSKPPPSAANHRPSTRVAASESESDWSEHRSVICATYNRAWPR